MEYEFTVIKYLSFSRIKSYEELLKQQYKNKSVLELYKENIKISKNVYELLSYFEIFLRNRIDSEMSKIFGEKWLFNINLREKHKIQLNEAIERKVYKNKDDIIANLQLGFWIHLFDKNYESELWVKTLNKIFPKKMQRVTISNMLKNIGILRNRISHYEIIIKDYKLLTTNIQNILYIIKILNTDIYNWILDNCCSVLNELIIE